MSLHSAESKLLVFDRAMPDLPTCVIWPPRPSFRGPWLQGLQSLDKDLIFGGWHTCQCSPVAHALTVLASISWHAPYQEHASLGMTLKSMPAAESMCLVQSCMKKSTLS